jgi:general stress protein 26
MRLRTIVGLLLMPLVIALCALTSTGFAQNQPSSKTNPDSLIAAAREIMGQQKYCALATVDADGRMNIRTMNPFPPEKDMKVWIATNSRSRKAGDIRRNPSVSLYYADHGRATGYVTISGKAFLVDDKKEKLNRKRDYWTQAFPDWKYLVLIKVVPERIEVVNYKRGFIGDTLTWKAPALDVQHPSPTRHDSSPQDKY